LVIFSSLFKEFRKKIRWRISRFYNPNLAKKTTAINANKMGEEVQKEFDVLDMNNYKMEKLPTRDKSKFEKFLMKIGSPLAIISFILILYVFDFSFLHDFDIEKLG
jgi:hypothetical protein